MTWNRNFWIIIWLCLIFLWELKRKKRTENEIKQQQQQKMQQQQLNKVVKSNKIVKNSLNVDHILVVIAHKPDAVDDAVLLHALRVIEIDALTINFNDFYSISWKFCASILLNLSIKSWVLFCFEVLWLEWLK